MLTAQAWPGSTLVGFDYHADSIDQARKRAAEAGVADRCRFEVASAKDYPAGGYDLVATFDCLHNMGAQAGEAAIREVVTEAGFTRFRRAAETPFNLVYEARP